MSVLKHQVPRLILPAIIPLSLLIANILIEHKSLMHVFGWTWIGFNILLLFVFGLLHQGGVVPCISYLQQKCIAYQRQHWTHLLSYILANIHDPSTFTCYKANSSSNSRVKPYDFAGASTKEVERLINAKLNEPNSKEDRVVSIL